MSVFILFLILQAGVINYTERETVAIKIHSHSLTVVCLILFLIWDHLKSINPTGIAARYFLSNKGGLPKK